MKKVYSFILSVFVLFGTSYSQGEMDFGLNLGGASYLGEIGGTSGEAKPWLLDMKLSQSNIAGGGFFRYGITNSISAKLSVNFVRIEGADSLSEEPTRIGRNLSFRTDMIEAVVTAEYKFFQINDLSRRSRQRIDFSSYVLAGAGVLLYYPYAQTDEGKWVELRPLQTEGAANAYSEMTIALPIGAGANFTFNKKIRVGVEFGYRFTFTDYLDDVSTRYQSDEELATKTGDAFDLQNRSAQAFARDDGRLSEAGLTIDNYSQGIAATGLPGSIRGGEESNDGYLVAQIGISYVIGGGNSFYKSKYNSIINRRRKRTKF